MVTLVKLCEAKADRFKATVRCYCCSVVTEVTVMGHILVCQEIMSLHESVDYGSSKLFVIMHTSQACTSSVFYVEHCPCKGS